MTDDTYTESEVRELIREACKSAGGVTRWATANGVAQTYVSSVLTGKRACGATVAGLVGFRPERVWRRRA